MALPVGEIFLKNLPKLLVEMKEVLYKGDYSERSPVIFQDSFILILAVIIKIFLLSLILV
jgi:hypothetical protein